MLLTLLICIGFLFIIGSIIIYKHVLNPVFMILTWYITGIIISHSGLFGMYKPADKSSEFILSNIFILCYTFFVVSTTKSIKTIQINTWTSKNALNKVFSIMRILSFLTETAIALHLVKLIMTGALSISSIRLIVYSLAYDSNNYTLIFYNKLIYYIFNFFIKGFILFDVSWNFCEVLSDLKNLRYISLINLFLYCFIILSRIEILRIIIIFLLAIISNRYLEIKIKVVGRAKQRRYWKAVILFIIAMFVIFSFRTSSGTSVVSNSIQDLVVNLTGSYVVFGNFFTYYFNGLRLINSNIIAMLFGGLEPVFYSILRLFGITINLPTTVLNEYSSVGTNIGASSHYNAFYTMYYNFLAGGGVIGCIVVSVLLGALLGILYKSYIKMRTSESLLVYIFGLHIIILGSIRWELSTFSLWVMLILIIFIMSRRKKLRPSTELYDSGKLKMSQQKS